MSLRDLEAVAQLNTSTDQLIKVFYVPALSLSARYDRGVGFFSSAWLRMVASGLVKLAANRGIGRIIASPILSKEDWGALNQGAEARTDPRLFAAMQRTLDELAADLEGDTLSALAWMVADGLLEFRIAIPTNDLDGDFHDKFGQFHDSDGNVVAFHGSPNDSARAFRNYESISCFYSWIDDREAGRVANEVTRFERLWDNRDSNLRVFSLPETIRRNLVQFAERSARPYPEPPGRSGGRFAEDDRRWRHQKEALAAFMTKRNGVLEMATGTGKTRTALNILSELLDRGLINTAIVTMSGTDLLDQWRRELLRFDRLLVYRAYDAHKEQQQYLNHPAESALLISRQQLPAVLERLPSAILGSAVIVCDEVHGMGSERLVRDLDGKISPFAFRLGLSATPDREYDADGNAFIAREIGDVIFRFGLEDAIKREILCELDYVALNYTLSNEDRAEIADIFRTFHGRKAAGEPVVLEEMYQRIASVRKRTITKLPPFQAYLASNPGLLERCLIFVDNMEYGHLVQRLLLPITGKFHTYYGSDDRKELERFARGDIECLITCHRISEGIDIRSVNNIVLFASSRARLESIQRIGRCLRIDPANPAKRALVVDFIEVKGDEDSPINPDSADQDRQRWFDSLSQVRREVDA